MNVRNWALCLELNEGLGMKVTYKETNKDNKTNEKAKTERF